MIFTVYGGALKSILLEAASTFTFDFLNQFLFYEFNGDFL